jgi:predicted transcriptional regulator
LRAIVWHFNGSLHRATRIASGVGQVVAFGFIAWGVYTMFSGNFFGGLWIAFIGWFLQNAAAATLAQSNLEHSLRDVTVKRVMTLEYPRIPVGLTLQKLVDDYLLRGEGRYFIVFDGSEPRGLVTLNEITVTPRENWTSVTAGQVMIPNEKLISVAPNTELLTALQIMDQAGVAQVPVNENGQMIGILSREQILRYISLSHSLGLMKALEKSNPVSGPVIALRLDKPAKS